MNQNLKILFKETTLYNYKTLQIIMPNYQNSKIYIIRSNSTQTVYVGSTVRKLSERMSCHRTRYKGKRDTSSSELIKHGDAYIELIEAYPCNSKEELLRREGEVMRATENTVNKNVAGRTKKQWREENKIEIKQYRVDHKAEIDVQQKQYKGKIIRCECGIELTRGNIPRHKKSKSHKTEMEILELANE